ncbi:MFS transporter [Candidatus Saccharibacteria bacterium]|nr:MFS transporter [Candidatus Saccharibacteria bacterium]
MTEAYKRRLERNIIKFAWFKIFSKQVYLPLIAVYLVQVGHVSLAEIALIAIVGSITEIALQTPTGYFADKYGNRRAILVGAVIAMTIPWMYMLMPNIWGGVLGAMAFATGFAFYSGSLEAFLHDTLKELGRERSYTKIVGRSQTMGLVGNAILVTLVPLTYSIDPRLPFLLGFLSLGMLLILALNFEYPKVEKKITVRGPIRAVKSIVSWRNLPIFVFAGFVSGAGGGDYSNLVLTDIGLTAAFLGVVQAVSSLFGAVLGWYIHIFDRVAAKWFYLTDLLISVCAVIVLGLTQDVLVASLAVAMAFGWWRVRHILYQAKLLKEMEHIYKATLLSTLSTFSKLGNVTLVLILGMFVTGWGLQNGFVRFGLATLIVGLGLWVLAARSSRARIKA